MGEQNEAYVTLATNDQYGFGCLVLARSLRRTETSRHLVVMVTSGVSQPMRTQLQSVYDLVHTVDLLDSHDPVNLSLLGRPDLNVTFTKLHCWRLTQYTKGVFLDADTLVLRNIDDLFDREELSAAPDAGWPDCFNSGVFVFQPSQETYDSLVQFALTHGSFDGGDQGLLNSYFSDWSTKDIKKHLPFVYNVVSQAFYSYLPAFAKFRDNVRIVHFIGALKPWHHTYNQQTGEVTLHPRTEHDVNFLKMWWTIFLKDIQPVIHAQLRATNRDIVGDDSVKLSIQPMLINTVTPSQHIVVSTNTHNNLEEQISHGTSNLDTNFDNDDNNDLEYKFENEDENRSAVENYSNSENESNSQNDSNCRNDSDSQNDSKSQNHLNIQNDGASNCNNSQIPEVLESSNINSSSSKLQIVESSNAQNVENSDVLLSEDASTQNIDTNTQSTESNTQNMEINTQNTHTNTQSNETICASDSNNNDTNIHINNSPPQEQTPPIEESPEETPETPQRDIMSIGLAPVFASGDDSSISFPFKKASESERKLAWERGEIDYLGSDSFENIQKKLDKTMEQGSSESVVSASQAPFPSVPGATSVVAKDKMKTSPVVSSSGAKQTSAVVGGVDNLDSVKQTTAIDNVSVTDDIVSNDDIVSKEIGVKQIDAVDKGVDDDNVVGKETGMKQIHDVINSVGEGDNLSDMYSLDDIDAELQKGEGGVRNADVCPASSESDKTAPISGLSEDCRKEIEIDVSGSDDLDSVVVKEHDKSADRKGVDSKEVSENDDVTQVVDREHDVPSYTGRGLVLYQPVVSAEKTEDATQKSEAEKEDKTLENESLDTSEVTKQETKAEKADEALESETLDKTEDNSQKTDEVLETDNQDVTKEVLGDSLVVYQPVVAVDKTEENILQKNVIKSDPDVVSSTDPTPDAVLITDPDVTDDLIVLADTDISCSTVPTHATSDLNISNTASSTALIREADIPSDPVSDLSLPDINSNIVPVEPDIPSSTVQTPVVDIIPPTPTSISDPVLIFDTEVPSSTLPIPQPVSISDPEISTSTPIADPDIKFQVELSEDTTATKSYDPKKSSKFKHPDVKPKKSLAQDDLEIEAKPSTSTPLDHPDIKPKHSPIPDTPVSSIRMGIASADSWTPDKRIQVVGRPNLNPTSTSSKGKLGLPPPPKGPPKPPNKAPKPLAVQQSSETQRDSPSSKTETKIESEK